MRRHTLRKVVPWGLLALGCLAAFAAGRGAPGVVPGLGSALALADEPAAPTEEPAAPATPVLTLTVRAADRAGLRAGEIMAGERVLLEVVVPAGGLSGFERAMIIADRMNRQLEAGAEIAAFSTEVADGVGRFMHEGATICTVTPDDAAQAGRSVEELTAQWAEALRSVLPGYVESPPPPPDTTDTPDPTEATPVEPTDWVPPEPYEDKFVPILSILRGVRVGAARVNGPKSAIDLVQGVGQLEIKFKDTLDIEVYIPLSTKEPGKKLARVQSVGVTALGDFKL